jgi:hypothetical protein
MSEWRGLGGAKMADQSATWAEFRKRRRFALIVLIASVPWLGLAILLPRTMKFHDPLVGALMAVWFAVWVYAMAQFLLNRCPRCAKYFSQTRLLNLAFVNDQCVNCGLHKYSNW